jgi:hypothetical protein
MRSWIMMVTTRTVTASTDILDENDPHVEVDCQRVET